MLAPALDRMHSTHPHSLPGTHYSDAEGVVDYVTFWLKHLAVCSLQDFFVVV